MPGVEVKISEPDEYGDGEICVKGPNVMLGYYEDPEATAAVFDEDGFFRTGDLGHLDEDGWVYITGRLKNLIILANGKNVYPEEIETKIQGIYGVSEVVVYAGASKNDPDREVIVAFVDGLLGVQVEIVDFALDLGQRVLELGAALDDASGGGLQLAVFLGHAVDRVLVSDFGMRFFNGSDEQAQKALPQIKKAAKKSHLTSPSSQTFELH